MRQRGNNWNDLICFSSQPSNGSRYEECSSGYGAYWDSVDCYSYANVYVCDDFYSPVNGQSDGLYKASSQTGYNSAWSSNAVSIEIRNVDGPGVNHRQLDGSDAFYNKLDDIFVGRTNASPFFKTSPR